MVRCKSMGKGRTAMSPFVHRCVCGRQFCQFVFASYPTFPSFLSMILMQMKTIRGNRHSVTLWGALLYIYCCRYLVHGSTAGYL